MATKIRRSLFIGLGGTGMKALLHTKKMFIDTYGEVPPMIGFLGIDTDPNEYAQTVIAANGNPVGLEANEQCRINLQESPQNLYTMNRSKFTWLPSENVFALVGLMDGAGQVRSNGRFAFTVNRNRVASSIQTKLNSIQSASIIDNEKYELLSNEAPEVHMVFSISGGTGAGTFINMAYLVRQIVPNLRLGGYAIMPEVFHAMSIPTKERLRPNAYGALVDLDFLMSRDWQDAPLKLEYLIENNNVDITNIPFDSVMLIDNTNGNNDKYDNVDKLVEMVSLALVTSSGDIGALSTLSNFKVSMAEGTMNIHNKRAWAGGLGACEIIYRGEALADIYRMKAAQQLIARLTSSTADADAIANAWIDSAEVRIRENNGHDDVIDFIADAQPQIPFYLNDKASIAAEIETNKSSNKLKDEAVSGKVEELVSRVRGELRELIVEHINNEGGIALAKNILNTIKAQVQTYMGEMTTEIEDMQNAIPAINGNIQALSSEIEKAWFGAKDARARLADEMRNYNTNIRDIQRHNAAITVYNSILVMIEENLAKVNGVEDLLVGVNTKLATKIAKVQAGTANRNQSFQINLAADEATRIAVNGDEIIVADFVKTLGGEFKLYGLNDFSSSEVEKMLLSYTGTLSGANAYAEKGVEDVLREMRKDDLKLIIRRAIDKSMPLFCYSYGGRIPVREAQDFFYIGVKDKTNTILKEGNIFEEVLGSNNEQFASIGMNDKIIIYRQKGVAPVYTVAGLDRMHGEYLQQSVNCHFDANIQRRMESDGFSIYPVVENNNDMLDLWVKGFIYGLLKNESGCYYMKSQSLGQYLDDYWVRLDPWRDVAFEKFKSHESDVVRDFNAHINAENARMGEDALRQLITDVKRNYLDGYSQLRITRQTLGSHGYERVARLVEQEGQHVTNNL